MALTSSRPRRTGWAWSAGVRAGCGHDRFGQLVAGERCIGDHDDVPGAAVRVEGVLESRSSPDGRVVS